MSDDSGKNDEESLFRSAMRDVTPLKSNNKVTLKRSTKKNLMQPNSASNDLAFDNVFSDSEDLHECPDILEFSRSGLQYRVLKKLRQGKYPVEDVLDLHGLTVDHARKALLTFLAECETTGFRHVIIIHGKGFRSRNKPVIKAMVNRWLRAVDNVLAFHSAQPKDGGSGAVYVLLRRLPDGG